MNNKTSKRIFDWLFDKRTDNDVFDINYSYLDKTVFILTCDMNDKEISFLTEIFDNDDLRLNEYVINRGYYNYRFHKVFIQSISKASKHTYFITLVYDLLTTEPANTREEIYKKFPAGSIVGYKEYTILKKVYKNLFDFDINIDSMNFTVKHKILYSNDNADKKSTLFNIKNWFKAHEWNFLDKN